MLSASPYGETKRRRWNEEEKRVAFTAFHEYITEKKLPSLLHIETVRSQNQCLQKRSAAVIKTWIHNQIKKEAKVSIKTNTISKDTAYMCRKEIKIIFANHISRNTIPSINECIIAYKKSKILQKLGPIDIQDMILKEIHDP